MTLRTGRFVTLEGGEGAGKSTLARSLRAALAQKGRSVLLTREPGGSSGADDIRALLVRGDPGRWSPLTETLLLTAARNDHLERTIRPALASGQVVICDRYLDSTRAYQGGDAPDTLARLIQAETPDLTLLLDIDPSSGLKRSRGASLGEDRFERMALERHQEIRRAFLAIAAAEPQRCRVIDASQPHEAVLAQALLELEAVL